MGKRLRDCLFSLIGFFGGICFSCLTDTCNNAESRRKALFPVAEDSLLDGQGEDETKEDDVQMSEDGEEGLFPDDEEMEGWDDPDLAEFQEAIGSLSAEEEEEEEAIRRGKEGDQAETEDWVGEEGEIGEGEFADSAVQKESEIRNRLEVHAETNRLLREGRTHIARTGGTRCISLVNFSLYIYILYVSYKVFLISSFCHCCASY